MAHWGHAIYPFTILIPGIHIDAGSYFPFLKAKGYAMMNAYPFNVIPMIHERPASG